MNPKVSVVIPNYNYGRFLGEAIDSALNQSLRPHEVVVVDDGSTDCSDEVLEKYRDRVLVLKQQNQGVGVARNKGATAASGELIAFLDADDYWAPRKLERQVEKLSESPHIGLVGCGVINVREDGEHINTDLNGMEGWATERLLRFQPTVPANTLLLRKEVFESVQGFDTRPEMHPSEDWDLCYRISLKYKFGFVPEPLFYYRQHGKGGHTNIHRMERSMMLGFEKAFAVETSADRNAAYASLYRILSGSYFRSHYYSSSIRTAILSICYRPAEFGYFLAFPFRRFKRKGNL